MSLFYDPVNNKDLRRVEKILKSGGVEYVLREEPEKRLAPFQVHVAEEDVPRAEELLREWQQSH